MEETPGSDAKATLLALTTALRLERALWAAAELGVADHLGEEPVPLEALAARVGAHPEALGRVLRVLASLGIFRETESGAFLLTRSAAPLRSDAPDGVRDLVRQQGGPEEWRAWGEILHSVRTGEPAFAHVWGRTPWDLYGRTRGRQTTVSRQDSTVLAESPLFAGVEHVVDVAGGEGDFLAALLAAHPHMRGTLFDRPSVVEGAEALLTAAGVAGRCRIVGGDMFEGVPGGGDLYILKRTLHDWNDPSALRLLRSLRRSMPDDATLAILTRVLPPAGVPSSIHPGDLALLVMLGGRHRTPDDIAELLDAAGFSPPDLHPLPGSPLVALVAKPVS